MTSHAAELAVVDHSDPKTDDVVVVPQTMLKAGETIDDDRLPFDVQVVEFFAQRDAFAVEVGRRESGHGRAGSGSQSRS